MKTRIWQLIALLAISLLSMNFVSCGDDDNNSGDNGNGSKTINTKALVGASFYKIDEFKGGPENIERTRREITFLSESTAQVQVFGSGIDIDGKYSWDYGIKTCTFNISGNKMTIPYHGNNNYEEILLLEFDNNMPIGWTYVGGGNLDNDGNDDNSALTVLVGYYMDEGLLNGAKKHAEQQVAIGNTDWAYFNNIFSGGWGIRIISGTTMYYVRNGVMVTDPSKTLSGAIVLKTESYTVNREKRTLYYYMMQDAQEEHTYTRNGQVIVLDDGRKLTFDDNRLVTESGSAYVKLK